MIKKRRPQYAIRAQDTRPCVITPTRQIHFLIVTNTVPRAENPLPMNAALRPTHPSQPNWRARVLAFHTSQNPDWHPSTSRKIQTCGRQMIGERIFLIVLAYCHTAHQWSISRPGVTSPCQRPIEGHSADLGERTYRNKGSLSQEEEFSEKAHIYI